MQDFINSVTDRLGIDQDQAKSAVGSVLSMLRKEGGADGGALLDKLPGASALADETESSGSGGGGGGLLGKVTGMLGGLGGGAGGLAGLASSGLSGDKLKDFAKMFVDWAKEKAGDDLVNKVVSKVPGLSSIL
jgi:hypothetical protein